MSGLQQPVLELLQAGRTRLAQILEDVERLSEGWSSELGLLEEPPEETVARAVDPVNAIGEIVFVASLELRLSEERLRSAGATSATTLLAECDSALRHLAKGLRAVVHAASRSREEPRVSAHVELAVSRQVRRAYARFRRRIAAAEAAPDLHSRFRAAGTQIAMLVGHEAYPRMRVRDRLVLQDLQRRILAWLRDGGIDAKAGEQLCKISPRASRCSRS
ncbi:MAG TPA: hypothetical protein VFQ35_23710 [Polyangiaceae bacterium]|nr:hypothetical protein [Polyangiaceae bacterium]